jgi:chromatin modification-related protein YNG2
VAVHNPPPLFFFQLHENTHADDWIGLRHCCLKSYIELQQDIAKDQAKYIKYSLRQDPAFPSFAQIGSKLNGAAGETPQGEVPQVSTQNKPVPKAHLPARIAASYVEIDALSNEKVTLVQRIIDLITRTRARVDANLAHVQVLQGESVSTPYNARRPEGMSGSLNLVVQSGEGVLRALTTRTGSADSIVPSTPPATVSGPPYNKSVSHCLKILFVRCGIRSPRI